MSLSAEERGGPAISLFTPTDKEMRFLIERYSFILFRLVLLSSQSRGLVIPLIKVRDNSSQHQRFQFFIQFQWMWNSNFTEQLCTLWLVNNWISFAEQCSFIQCLLVLEKNLTYSDSALGINVLLPFCDLYSGKIPKKVIYKKEESQSFLQSSLLGLTLSLPSAEAATVALPLPALLVFL